MQFAPVRPQPQTTAPGRKQTSPANVAYVRELSSGLGEVLAQGSRRAWDSLLVEGVAQPMGLPDTRLHLSPEQQARLAPPWNGALRSQAWTSGAFASAGFAATVLLVFSRALMQGRSGPIGACAERLVTDLAAFGENGTRIGYGIFMPKAPARTWGHDGETRAYNTERFLWPDANADGIADQVAVRRRGAWDSRWKGRIFPSRSTPTETTPAAGPGRPRPADPRGGPPWAIARTTLPTSTGTRGRTGASASPPAGLSRCSGPWRRLYAVPSQECTAGAHIA